MLWLESSENHRRAAALLVIARESTRLVLSNNDVTAYCWVGMPGCQASLHSQLSGKLEHY